MFLLCLPLLTLFLSLGKHLDITDPGNYRGISISSTLSKLFELVVQDIVSLPYPSLSTNYREVSGKAIVFLTPLFSSRKLYSPVGKNK